jgi:hypothetical protein
LSIIVKVVRIIVRKLRTKPQINYTKTRFIRPALTVAIFLSIVFFVRQSLHSANEYAIETGKKDQAEAEANGICPKKIKGWEAGKYDPNDSVISYGKYGTKYPVRYHTSKDMKEFVIVVRHNIDEGLHVNGGVNRELKATYWEPGNSADVPIE